jgi:hypothetical protein
MPSDRRLLCVSLHDVAPATLHDCIGTLAFLDRLRIGPVALLVVPDYHGEGRIDRDERFCNFLRARARRGDEIVLHGFWHRDDAGPCRGLRDIFERRIATDSEGEFAHLGKNAARARLLRGLAILRAAGWQPKGFVAPAWLMSPGTRDALDSLPLEYCSTRDLVLSLKSDRVIPAPSLVVSTRGLWRRAVSPIRNQAVLSRRDGAPVLRAALHPADLSHPGIESMWRRLFGQLAYRKVLTEAQLTAL